MSRETPAFRSVRLPSIVRRAWTITFAAIAVGAGAGALAAAVTVSQMVRHLAQSSLEEAAQALVVLAENDEAVTSVARDRVLPASPHREVLVWQLRSSDGKLVLRSHDAPAGPWSAPLVEGHQEIAGLALFTLAGNDRWLQVALPLNHLHRSQRVAAMQAGGVVVLVGLLAAAVGTWRLRAELHPLRKLAHDVDAITSSTVALERPRSPRLELAPVYDALGQLLRRQAEQLRSERAFAARAAHSLRTPLAGLTAQLELARLQAPAELKFRHDQALAAARRLAGVVGGLLALGRAGGPVAWQTFEAAELGRVALGGAIEVDRTPLEGAPRLRGNLDLLAAAVANLVDNSARHGASKVRLAASVSDDLQCIRVADDGPGVPAERLELLREALRRVDFGEDVNGPVGLGLTLAAAAARVHGGGIDIDCIQQPLQGFCVRLCWPLQPPAAAEDRP